MKITWRFISGGVGEERGGKKAQRISSIYCTKKIDKGKLRIL